MQTFSVILQTADGKTQTVPNVVHAEMGEAASKSGFTLLSIPNDNWGETLALAADAAGNVLAAGTTHQGPPLTLPLNDDLFQFRPHLTKLSPAGRQLGTAVLDPGLGSRLGTDAEFHGVGVDADGKIVCSGSIIDNAVSNGNYYSLTLLLARFNPDLTLDTTFGNGKGYVTYFPSGAQAVGTGVRLVIQPDYYLLGFTKSYAEIGRYQMHRFHKSDGALDITFGAGGTVANSLVPNVNCATQCFRADPQGRLVMPGYSDRAISGRVLWTCRWNPDGTPDLTFGGAGQDPNGALTVVGPNEQYDDAADVAFYANGLIVAGQCDVTGGCQFCLVGYTNAGQPDPTFGAGGIAKWQPPNPKALSAPNYATMLPDGSLLVTGQTADITNTGFSDGSEIVTAVFSPAGVVTGSARNPFGPPTRSDVCYAGSGLYVGGHRWAGTRAQASVGKLAPDGTADTNFGA